MRARYSVRAIPWRWRRQSSAGGSTCGRQKPWCRADTERTPARKAADAGRDPNTVALEQDLSRSLGLTVCLTPKGAGGTLQIGYRSLDQLDALIKRLR